MNDPYFSLFLKSQISPIFLISVCLEIFELILGRRSQKIPRNNYQLPSCQNSKIWTLIQRFWISAVMEIEALANYTLALYTSYQNAMNFKSFSNFSITIIRIIPFVIILNLFHGFNLSIQSLNILMIIYFLFIRLMNSCYFIRPFIRILPSYFDFHDF